MNLELISPEGTRLDLFPDTVIGLDLKNPAMNAEVLEGSFSYTFSLPLSDRNRVYFKFPEHVASAGALLKSYSGFRLKSGLVEFLCTLVVRSVSGGKINVNLRTASGEIAEDLKRLSIRDVDMGEEVIPSWKSYMAFAITYVADGYTVAKLVWSTESNPEHLVLYHADYVQSPPLGTLVDSVKYRINNATPMPEIIPMSTFSFGELGYFGDHVYGAHSADAGEHEPTGGPTDNDWWIWICEKANFDTWRAYQAENYIFGDFLWWAVDSFNDDKRALAEEVDGKLVVYDPVNSAAKFLNPDLSFTLSNDFNSWAPYDDELLTLPSEIAELVTENSIMVSRFMKATTETEEARQKIAFFPIHNPKMVDDSTYCSIVNYIRDGVFYTNIYNLDKLYVMSAQPRLVHAIESLATWFGKTIEDHGVLSNSFIKSLFVYSNFSNDKLARRSPVDDEFLRRYDSFTKTIYPQKSMPQITIADFLNGVRAYLFIGFWFDANTNKMVIRFLRDLITDFENAIDITNLVGDFNELISETFDGVALRYTHDPGDGFIGEFLANEPYFDGKTIIAAVDEVEDLPVIETNDVICLVKSLDHWYINKLQDGNEYQWLFHCRNMVDLKIGNGDLMYNPKCSTLLMYEGHDFCIGPKYEPRQYYSWEGYEYKAGDWVQDSEGQFYVALVDNDNEPLDDEEVWSPQSKREWKIPMSNQGRFSETFDDKSNCTLRLLSFVGELPNPFDEDEMLPLATNDLYRDAGVLWPEERGGSLKWDGEFGIYQQFGKEWLDFIQTKKKVEFQLPLTESLLSQLKPWKLVKVGGNFYVLGSIKANLPLHKSLATVTLYLVR